MVEREEVIRSRVRVRDDNGASHSIELATYRMLKALTQLQTRIIQVPRVRRHQPID
ncbi:hypothetical protein RRSWK_00406 [Rhodopirellula sp. SWK7]|nr:hypothetical protein RRSWK_00406 [Rhodopirellula sp. SWK7]